MFHYTYVIHNEHTGQYYIGLRSSKKEPNADPYMGSGKWLKEEMRIRPEGWSKYILGDHPTREAAVEDEAKSTHGHLGNGLCLNLVHGGSAWLHSAERVIPQHTRERMSASAKRRAIEKPITAETIAKIVAKTTGQKRSVEFCTRMSDVHRNKIVSTEAKGKISKAIIARPKAAITVDTNKPLRTERVCRVIKSTPNAIRQHSRYATKMAIRYGRQFSEWPQT